MYTQNLQEQMGTNYCIQLNQPACPINTGSYDPWGLLAFLHIHSTFVSMSNKINTPLFQIGSPLTLTL